jgi:aerobic-type carbon monoxide dehydrogenase small subunit (CoxS/CutS family)
MVYPEFCYYVKRIYENNEIRKYIEDIKKVDGEDIYKYLETLYCRCKEYEG